MLQLPRLAVSLPAARRARLAPHVLPFWAHPLFRLGVAVLLVLAGDRLTALLVGQGWTMSLGLVTALRVASALPILRFPLAGFLLALEVDKWDWYWLDAGNRGEDFEQTYQRWDKVLDLLVLGAAAAVAMGWEDARLRLMALASLAWRVAGVGVYLLSGAGWTLVLFPNVFQSLFAMYLVYYLLTGRPQMLRSWWAAAVAGVAVVLPKLAEEYFIHVLGGRPWGQVTLPTPDAIEPFLWVLATYLPAVLVVAVLAIARRGEGRRGDRETQLSAT